MKWLLLLTSLFLLFSCTPKVQDSSGTELENTFQNAGIPLLKQKLTPRDFSLPLASPQPAPILSGNQSLGSLTGKVVFLNFWATWCGPCRDEMPSMETLYNRYRDRGLEILAVNSGESQSQVNTFMKEYGLSFPVVLDSDSRVSQTYGIQGIPTTFLIDRQGKIILRVVGSLHWDTPEVFAAFDKLIE